jgi:hypothetical protein
MPISGVPRTSKMLSLGSENVFKYSLPLQRKYPVLRDLERHMNENCGIGASVVLNVQNKTALDSQKI